MIERGTQTITTDRLILRRFSLADVEGYYKAVKDPKLYQFIAYNPCTSIEATQEYISDIISHYKDPYYFEWVITKDDQIIGSISATNVNIFNRSIELGFILSAYYWHRGYMKEAGPAVLEVLKKIGFHKVIAYVEEGNTSSMHLCLSLGMHLEGCFEDEILLKDGSYRSLYHYGLIFHNEK